MLRIRELLERERSRALHCSPEEVAQFWSSAILTLPGSLVPCCRIIGLPHSSNTSLKLICWLGGMRSQTLVRESLEIAGKWRIILRFLRQANYNIILFPAHALLNLYTLAVEPALLLIKS
jgi:hypothetical protein